MHETHYLTPVPIVTQYCNMVSTIRHTTLDALRGNYPNIHQDICATEEE